jgi:hypothetical protein
VGLISAGLIRHGNDQERVRLDALDFGLDPCMGLSLLLFLRGCLSLLLTKGVFIARCSMPRSLRQIHWRLCRRLVVYHGLTHPASLEDHACNEALSLAFDLHQ